MAKVRTWVFVASVVAALACGGRYGDVATNVDASTGGGNGGGAAEAQPSNVTSFRGRGALRSDGAYFQHAATPGSIDVLLRRSIDGTTEVLYTEATRPRVKVSSYVLLTGP